MRAALRGPRDFASCEKGVAAIEIGLIGPLLILLLVGGVELGRMYQAYRMFDNAVVGISRELVGFPEYDSRARTYAPYFAAALLPPGWSGRFNLQVTSLQKDQNAMQTVFTDTLFGQNPGLARSLAVSAASYDQGESVILIDASYRYVPLFGMFSTLAYTMTKSYALNPYFSRAYRYNAGQSADKYVN